MLLWLFVYHLLLWLVGNYGGCLVDSFSLGLGFAAILLLNLLELCWVDSCLFIVNSVVDYCASFVLSRWLAVCTCLC